MPNEPSLELAAMDAYRAREGSCLLCDYAVLELTEGERIVSANDGFIAIVPFWAVWPFETLVLKGPWYAPDGTQPDVQRHFEQIFRMLSGDDLTAIPPARASILEKLLPPTGVAAEFEDQRRTSESFDCRARACIVCSTGMTCRRPD